jgi:Mg-chelatase subunit ChlD
VNNNEVEKVFVERIVKGASILSKFSIKAYGIEGSAETRQLQVQKDATTELEKFQSTLETVLAGLSQAQIMVLIDKVDDVWNQTEESEMMIVGLIKAVHDLHSTLRQTHFILFLRSDIYDTLKFNDADKLHSLEERLSWRDEELKHLVATRGKVSTGLSTSDTNELWEIIFDKTVNGEPSFNYLLNRTLKRPRELIQFCNNALTEAQDNQNDHITAQDILRAERLYSNWKLKDLASEFTVQYPYLEELLSLFQGFKTEFGFDEFDKRYQETKVKLANPDLQTVSTERMLQILFIVGFLGTRVNKKNIFVYDNPLILLPQQEQIIIHPAYHFALGLQWSSSVPTSDGAYIRGDINISGDIVGGDKVVQVHYEPIMSSSRELEQLELQMKELLKEKVTLQEKMAVYPVSELPVRLKHRLQDVEEQIKVVEQKTATTFQYLDSIREKPYETLATSRTPHLIIYVLDVSASMSQAMGEKTRVNIVELSLKSAIRQMVFRSTKGTRISPRYRIAMYAYSDRVYDILDGVKTVDEVAKLGIPILDTMRTTDTARAFLQVEKLLQREIPNNQNNPTPLVCHITDGEYTGDNPIPIIRRIMDMEVPDGNILVENIFISDDMLVTPIESPRRWSGIRSRSELKRAYAKVLFDVSSTIPESYWLMMKKNGYDIAPNARMLFPGSPPEFIEMGFVMSAATPVW